MTKILDFSNGKNIPALIIVNPTYFIANRSISIDFKDGRIPTFMVRVGCQSIGITEENIQKVFKELRGEELPSVLTKVIVPKGTNAKSNSVKLEAETENWLISKDKKAFEKADYEIKEMLIKEKRQYFIPSSKSYNPSMHFRGGYSLSKTDIDNINSILNKIQEYFQSK
jgi:hypothetical protein